jgi:GWxTD domain-containing protein
MKIFLYSILLLLITFLNTGISQNQFIPILVDYAFFEGTDSNNYLEIYISLFQSNLSYVNEEENYRAKYELSISLVDTDSVAYERSKITESVIDSLSLIKEEKQFISIFKFEIPNSDYHGKILFRDLNSGGTSEYFLEISDREFDSDEIMLSDIELASHISQEVPNSDFNKNTLCVLPNPSSTYTVINPLLYYYVEVYNLKYDPQSPGEYSIRNYISDMDGNVVKNFPEKSRKKVGESMVIVDGFNIVTLPEDIYYLNVEVQDQQTTQSFKKTKKFNLHKPGKAPLAEEGSANSEEAIKKQALQAYQNFTELDIDQEFEKARYVASSDEVKVYKSLDEEAKKVFMYEFWKRKNKEHPELYKSYRVDYMERVNLSNNLFSAGQRQGWKTDRGRVILQFGKPDSWDRHLMELDKKPYEIWYYDEIEGGVKFIFADLHGFGEFELIHSTYSQELKNTDWERLVRRAESSVGFDPSDEFMQ